MRSGSSSARLASVDGEAMTMQNIEESADDSSVAAVARRVELSEAHAYEQLIGGAAPELVERYGLACQRVGPAVALVAPGFSTSLILNRVIGLGVGETVTPDVLEAIDRLYAAAQASTYALEVSPAIEPANLATTLKHRGFFAFKQTAMLHRRVEPIAAPACAYRITRAQPEQAPIFAHLCVTVFGMDEPIRSLLTASFSGAHSLHWQHWLAWDGDLAVGAAITHLAGGVAWIGWVGTLASHRGRGVQSAITAAQLQAAHDSGCRWVTLETATGTVKRPNPSFRNYCRLGWAVAHHRLVFVHRGPADPGSEMAGRRSKPLE